MLCLMVLSGNTAACADEFIHQKLQNSINSYMVQSIFGTLDPTRINKLTHWLDTQTAPTPQQWNEALHPHNPNITTIQNIQQQYNIFIGIGYATEENTSWGQVTDRLDKFSQNPHELATVLKYKRKRIKKFADYDFEYTLLVVKTSLWNDVWKSDSIYNYMVNGCKMYPNNNQDIKVPQHDMKVLTKIDGIDAVDTEVYKMQEAVAETIYERIIEATRDKNYDSFRFVLLVPPKISLYNQSVKRYKLIFTEAQQKYHGQLSELIIRAGPGKSSQQAYVKLIESANKNPNTLHLLIQDECHWGMALGSQLDTKYLNTQAALNLANLYILHVSATPYNIQAIKTFVPSQIIKWDEVAETKDDLKIANQAYHGLSYLKQNNKLQTHQTNWSHIFNTDDQLQCLLYNVRAHSEPRLEFSFTGWSIIYEYVINLYYLINPINDGTQHPFYSEQTRTILQSLMEHQDNGRGNLVVIRVNNTDEAKNLKQCISDILKQYGKQHLFDVIADISSDDVDDLWDKLSPSSRQKYAVWRGMTVQSVNDALRDGTLEMDYSQLKYIPLLLIVVEKGRMGDTFPSNFKYFDLRSRYSTNPAKTMYCTLLQDVGRAFGYNDRPTTLLASEIIDLLDKPLLTPHDTLKRYKPVPADPNDQKNPDVDVDVKDDTCNDPYLDLNMYFCLDKSHQNHDIGNAPHTHKSHSSLSINHPAILRRFLLSANPQNGKTTSFFWAIKLLYEHFNNDEHKQQNQHKSQLYIWRTKRTSQDLHDALQNDVKEQQIFFEWHNYQENVYQKQQNDPQIIIPYKRAITGITTYINAAINKGRNLQNQPITVVDMGCGPANIARHFQQQQQHIQVLSIDHKRLPTIPDDINVIECCMDRTSISSDSVDMVVFSLSLWGVSGDIDKYLLEAYRICHTENGRILIIEAKKNPFGEKNIDMVDEINNALVRANLQTLQNPRLDDTYALWVAKKPHNDDMQL